MKLNYRAYLKELNEVRKVLRIVFEDSETGFPSPIEPPFVVVEGYCDLFPLDEVVLMQSTGLADCNFIEIFDGDVMVNREGKVGYVAYLTQEAGWVVVLEKSDYRLGHRNTGEGYKAAVNHRVIGNVHKNPELLRNGGVIRGFDKRFL